MNTKNGGHFLHEIVHTMTPVSTAALQWEDPRSRDFHGQSVCWSQTVAVAAGHSVVCSICL